MTSAWKPFRVVGFQIDLANQLERPEVIREGVAGMSDLGFNVCMLYLEDAYAYPRHPGIARPNACSVAFMQELQDICRDQGMELIPVIPALGHCHYITTKPGYERYDESRGVGPNRGTVSPSFPETYELLRELFEDWCRHVPGEYVHVGLDENPYMGQHAIQAHGLENFDATAMYAEHCNRVHAIVKDLGRRMVMFGDMFYHFPEAIERLNKEIIVLDWYYYGFEDVPSVEAFNFQKIDSAGALKAAGLEVWGCASCAASRPMPNVVERWENLESWIRYGREKGLEGIVDTDWGNSHGFYSNVDLLYRTYARHIASGATGSIVDTLGAMLVERSGNPAAASLAPDIGELGKYSLTEGDNRVPLTGPLTTMVNPAWAAGCRDIADRLDAMFPDLDAIVAGTADAAGQGRLEGIRQSYQAARVFWKTAAVVPENYVRLRDDAESAPEVAAALADLADELEGFVAAYTAHWTRVRFADDKPIMTEWARRAVGALRDWVAALDGRPLAGHPLFATPRLAMTIHCEHPAIPALDYTAAWPDGSEQSSIAVMIRFQRDYHVPDRKWTQFPVMALDKAELPAEIRLRVSRYGQVGVERVQVEWRGETFDYRLAASSGKNVDLREDALWLGPIGATVADPTIRPDADEAVYVPLPVKIQSSCDDF